MSAVAPCAVCHRGTRNSHDSSTGRPDRPDHRRVTWAGLQDLVAPAGTIAVMSSGQGSVGNNDRGGFEVYRASKSALNQLMRSFAARHADDPRTLLLMAPGWVQTDLGGLQYLHYRGQAVRW